MNTLKYKLTDGYAPQKNNHSDAGFDLRSPYSVVVPERGSVEINLGIAFEIPSGCYGAIESRSGMAFHNDVTAHRGIIDSGYRGNVKVKLFNHSDTAYNVHAGDKVCQLIVHRYEQVAVVQAKELSESNRGTNGFGSSGR